MPEEGRTAASAAVAEDGAARAALQLRLRARGIDDLDVLRALDLCGRDRFMAREHVHLARRDVAVPTSHGGSVPEAWLVGRMVGALALTRAERVLEVGTGSGYATAVLAHLAGHVITLDRYSARSAAAEARLARLGIENVTAMTADLSDVPSRLGRFSRIVVHACVDGMPNNLLRSLAPGGIVVLGRADEGGPARRRLVRLTSAADGRWSEDTLCRCRLPRAEAIAGHAAHQA